MGEKLVEPFKKLCGANPREVKPHEAGIPCSNKGNLIEVHVSNFFEDKAFEPELK